MAVADFSRINSNIGALNALNSLNKINSKLSMHQMRLATGKRINSAADDAAGFTIAANLDKKTRGLGTALDNIGSAKNMLTTGEGHLTNVLEILNQMKSKAAQAANDTLGQDERDAILQELQAFNDQINAEAGQAKWFDKSILTDSLNFQIGVGTSAANDELSVDIAGAAGLAGDFDSSGLDVVASASATGSVSRDSTVASAGISLTTLSAQDGGASNSLLNELDSGHYTLDVSVTSGATITVQLRDTDGDLVSINSDASASTTYVGTSMVTTGDGNLAEIDLGNGIAIDLGAITTATDQAMSVQFDYTKGGNGVDTMAEAQDFMDKIDVAIANVEESLSYIGSQYNRLSFQEESLTVAKINTEASYSRIMNADMASEQLEATKYQILQQTATSMLGQANASPQGILSLFR